MLALTEQHVVFQGLCRSQPLFLKHRNEGRVNDKSSANSRQTHQHNGNDPKNNQQIFSTDEARFTYQSSTSTASKTYHHRGYNLDRFRGMLLSFISCRFVENHGFPSCRNKRPIVLDMT